MPRLFKQFCKGLIWLSMLSGCEGGWDDEVVAPENFRSSYVRLQSSCQPSEHPKANYVMTWLNPEAVPTWEARSMGEDVTFAVGTVSVKAQYNDEACSSLSGYTLMEKVSTEEGAANGGWKWQFTDENGSCNDCNAGSGCVSCHMGSPNCVDLLCTQPEVDTVE